MKKIALLTDSTCDLPAALVEQYQIGLIPLNIIWDGKQYLDGVEMSAEAFYERLLIDPTHPTTSQPSPQVFAQAYQQAQENGADEVVVCTLSSAMSGTYQSACQGAESAAIPVHVHDARTNSMGLGWQVLAAARAREAGGGSAEMLQAADRARRSMVYIISLDTMEYLSRGGRIGGAVRFLSSVLKIKPQISVNHETGKVEAGMPARSRQKALEGLVHDFFNRIGSKRPLRIAVLHNAALDEAKVVAARIEAEYHPDEIHICIVSPILGVHTGPHAVALCGYTGD